MAQFFGTPAPISRFLGMLSADDPTNLPMGLAAECRNSMFDLTSVRTRDGFQTTMSLLDKSPVTGLMGMIYTPETANDSFFQLPIATQLTGKLQYENPVGSGQMEQFPPGLFTPPANSHAVMIQTYNKGYIAWSDLTKPLSQMCVVDPKTLNVDPYGMKPYGWTWTASTAVLVGEVATPTTPGGNGHTYRCIVAGSTGSTEPAWPLTEAVQFGDGSATWQEYTAVLANRLPNPAQPVVSRDSGVGTFAAGLDVYVVVTFLNGMGESSTSPTAILSNTVLNDALQVALPGLNAIPRWIGTLGPAYALLGYQVYIATVSHGDPAPPITTYQQVAGGPYPVGTNLDIAAPSSSGIFPPSSNTARITPGQLPTPSTEPTIQRVSTTGSFPLGRDVYVLQTYANSAGETPAGPASSIINTQLDDAVQATLVAPDGFPQIEMIGLYEADVATAQPAPPASQFALVGYYAPGATPTISDTAAGPPPPLVNTTGPAGNIVADQPNGGINGSQGYRYAAIMFMNRNFSVSGFTIASVIKYDVDEDGWEIAAFNVAIGPGNIIARLVAFGVADGPQAGPFYWIGNLNPQIPSANFVYPQQFISNGVPMTATIFADNTTTQGTFNFTDEFLIASNDVTDRTDIIWPVPCVHIAYHKSVDRFFQTGYLGNYGGCKVSLEAAPEDYYADTSDITVGSDDGERAWGTIEYRQISYLLRERSGLTLTANPNNPQEWSARGRWSGVGPCGPRAFDACDKFLFFVHESGCYRYVDEVDLMTKEIPYWWQQVNWAAATSICCQIDYETHQVQILLPINGSPVPNIKLMLNFEEGWANPIHYSTMSGREISVDACRKYSQDDMKAFVCARIQRQLPVPPDAVESDDTLPRTPSSFYVTQFVYGSSGPDGTIQASKRGTFDDNGSGIDWVYETVAPQEAMALSLCEGFLANMRGAGQIMAWFLGMRASKFQQLDGKKAPPVVPIKRPINLDIEQSQGISRMLRPVLSEKWRIRFTNNKTAGAWCSLKWITLYTIPLFTGRTEGEGSG